MSCEREIKRKEIKILFSPVDVWSKVCEYIYNAMWEASITFFLFKNIINNL